MAAYQGGRGERRKNYIRSLVNEPLKLVVCFRGGRPTPAATPPPTDVVVATATVSLG